MQNERSVHATGVFRDPMRACHADPIAEGHYAPAPTLPSSSSTVKASEKETIPDPFLLSIVQTDLYISN